MQKAVKALAKLNIKTQGDLMLAKRQIAKKYGVGLITNAEILRVYQELISNRVVRVKPKLIRLLRKRAIRTLSGIAPVAVLTHPHDCPGKCAYCPTEKNVPQSYLSNEPAVMRAIRCNYDPYVQVTERIRALEANGHEPTKIEIIVIGGTWSVLPRKYKLWYIANLFKAANDYTNVILERAPACAVRKRLIESQRDPIAPYSRSRMTDLEKDLIKEQKRNEKGKYKIIGLTLETRPDYIDEKELWEMRELGCTRVELGVQAVDDKILKQNKRGHGVKEIAEATKLLKDFGFKVTYHIMPGLPGSTPTKDFKMFKQLFTDERFQPDLIKFYPTVVTRGSLLYKWWKAGKYKPYSDKILRNLIIKCKKVVPPYVRIIRLIRDIPEESIEAGNRVTNLRQVMQDRGIECNCIRCREARQLLISDCRLSIQRYQASGGEEYFLEYTNKDKKVLYGFCRLRFSDTKGARFLLRGSSSLVAFIRELHIYGELVPVGSSKKIQHAGLGKKLLLKAEEIARKEGSKKMAVISGIGVRDYYRKQGYKLENTYMVKLLK
ncbi:elongator complex protein 3 [Patescibacteria group bacterium]